jgi:hypothetical protein
VICVFWNPEPSRCYKEMFANTRHFNTQLTQKKKKRRNEEKKR